MATKHSSVKRYIVTLSAAERDDLQTVIRSGRHPAGKLLRARMLLKADASAAGDARTEGQIATIEKNNQKTFARLAALKWERGGRLTESYTVLS